MNLWISILLGLVRLALTGLSGWLVAHHVITQSQTSELVYGVTIALISVGWTIWTKYHDRLKLLTALTLPPGSTVDQVKQIVSAGNAPAASTPNSVPPTAAILLLAVALGASALGLSACASVPPRQAAIVSVQAVEKALDTAQTAERQVCFVNPSTESGPHCTNPIAATVGLTDARHQQIAAALRDAFLTQAKVVDALALWAPGQPAPTSLATLTTQVQSALTVAQALVPQGQGATILADIQAVITAAQKIAAAVNGGN